MTQPEALLLADALEISSNHGIRRDAAAELRRLYMVDKLYQAALAGRNVMHLELHKANAERGTLQAQRDALLEALKTVEWHGQGSCWVVDADKIDAAIKAAEENT